MGTVFLLVFGRAQVFRAVACAVLLGSVVGCAGSVAPPVVAMALPKAERANLHVDKVSTEAAAGVALTTVDTDRITQLVIADLNVVAPGMLDPAAAGAKSVRIVVTRYDEGSAAARFMLAGVGQIRLDGTVRVVDRASGRTIGEYRVEKQFAFGGLYGGLTSIKDVEAGFAKSVAALLRSEP